jgi:hypothetical protein
MNETTQEQNNGAAVKPQALVKATTSEPVGSGTIDAFASASNFEAAQRMAKAFATSSLVPEAYRSNVPNVLIAMEAASRIGASVFAVMQNMDVIHGRPSWRSSFLIATVNASGRFSPLRFRFEGKPGTDEWGCRAVAKDRDSGEDCIGSLITMGLAKQEGWASKNGSKWKTMPEQMLMYRAAAFWSRVYAPELSLGMQTADEVVDVTPSPVQTTEAALRELEAKLKVESPIEAETLPVEPVVEREPGSEG